MGRLNWGPFAQARMASGLTQEEIASDLGVSIATVSNIERDPEEQKLSRIKQVYNLMNPEGQAIIAGYWRDFLMQ